MNNPHHEAIRSDQISDLDAALAVLRSVDQGGTMTSAITTVSALRRVLAATQDMSLVLLAHNARD